MRQFFLVDNLEGDDKMEEIWKDIEGYEGLYQVSNLGRVKSFYKEGRILKQCIDKDGYFCVGLFKNKKQNNKHVHRLVATAFVDGYFEGAVVNHIDENKQNNLWTNLEWVTNQYNVQYSSHKWSGENHPMYGKQRTEESKRKQGESRRGKYLGENNWNYDKGKKVRNKETGEIFPTLTKAGKSIGVAHTTISRAISKGKPVKGYHWEYV